MWQQASDWALRRLLKVLLKKNLKHVLATELDVEQLSVSLGTGALVLSDVLLSREWLAEHAPPGVEIVSGYIGRLRLELAVTSLTCSVQLDDVLVTVRPGGAAQAAAAAATAATAADAGPQPEGDRSSLGAAAGFGIDDGVRLVAAGVETLLQRMTVVVKGLSIRVEAGPGCIASLTCAQVRYGALLRSVDPQEGQAAAATTARRVSFSSLSLAVQEGGPPLLTPCGGQVDVTLSWPLEPHPGHQPHVSVCVSLEPIQAQLRPPDVVTVLILARSFAAAAQRQQQQALAAVPRCSNNPPAPGPGGQQPVHRGVGVPHHSFLEDLMLPECEGVVQDALLESAASITGQEDMDEFFDAKSLLGSLQQAFSSAMSASATSVMPGGASLAPGGGACHDDLDIFAMHDLAASIREVGGGVAGKQWSACLSAPSLTLCLLYPEGQAAGGSHHHFAPRLVAEALELTAQAESGGSSGGDGGDGGSLSLAVGVLEVAEHLPFPSTSSRCSPASSTAGSGGGGSGSGIRVGAGWLPAEEMARVPRVLPSAAHIQWPTPTFAGDYPLPDEAGSSTGFGDTLAQLSHLTQTSTVYQSATAMQNSVLQQSIVCRDAGVVPRVQIIPVLRCGGGSGGGQSLGAGLVLQCGGLVAPEEPSEGGDAAPGIHVALLLQPITVWCTLSLMENLQAFAARAVAPAAEPCAGRTPPPVSRQSSTHPQQEQQEQEQEQQTASNSRTAVAAAITNILQQQQVRKRTKLDAQPLPLQQQQPPLQPPPPQQQQQLGDLPPARPVRLSLYVPAICMVLAVPGLALPLTLPTDPPLPKYFVVDVQGSSSHLLASLAPRLGSQQPKALIASLLESGVEPTVVLQQQQGASASLAAAAHCAWTGAVRTGAVAVHAVLAGNPRPSGVGDSVLGPALVAEQVASITGPSTAARGGLSIDACWRQPTATPADVLDSLWAGLGGEPGSQAEHSALRRQLTANARLLVSITSVCSVAVTVHQAVLAAAGQLADGLLLLSAAMPPVGAATQAALLLDCECHCTLKVPQGAPFTVTARGVRAVACSGVSGVVGSSAAAVTIASLELTRADLPAGSTQLLCHATGQQQGDGRRRPAAQLFALLRPTGDPYLLCSNGRYVLPACGRIHVWTAGLTVLLDEWGQPGWLSDLQGISLAPPAASSALFAHSAGATTAAARSTGPAAAAFVLPAPPPALLHFAVSLSSSTVRYEPRDTSLAAAVLTAASITWQAQQGEPHSTLDARRLALHLAASAGAAGGRGRDGGSRLNSSAVPSAGLAGFHQVAAEAGVSLRLPLAARQQQQAPLHQQREAAAVVLQEVVVTNRGLTITLSRHTFLLLQRLARQLPGTGGSDGGSGGGGSIVQCDGGLSGSAGARLECSGSSIAASGLSYMTDSGRQPAAVNVMQGVLPSAYASSPRPRRSADHPLEASVFLDGGWYDPHQQAEDEQSYVMSPAGSPPALVDSFMPGMSPSRSAGALEGQGVWYDGEAVVEDEYVALRVPTQDAAPTRFGSPGYDCRVLPPGQPYPVRRIRLEDISITATLADTFATVLMPEDDSEGEGVGEGEQRDSETLRRHQSGQQQRRACSHRAAAAAAAAGATTAGTRAAAAHIELCGLKQEVDEEEEEVVPNSAQVQARLEGVCLQLDMFAAAAAAATQCDVGHVRVQEYSRCSSSSSAANSSSSIQVRCALVVRNLEVRDSFQRSFQGGSAADADAAAAGWSDLRRMLGYHASVHRVRDAKACMLQAVVEGVHSEPGAESAELEYRIHAQLLPLLLHLDQAALAFLQQFFAPSLHDEGCGGASSRRSGSTSNDADAGSASQLSGPALFFQRCEIQPFTLTINYHPHRVDLAALSSGQFTEVLNLVPWGGVNLHFRHLRLFGMQGLPGVGTAMASAYLEDISRFQARRFVGGIAPIKSICRVSSAVAQLLAIPKQQLYKRSSDGSASGSSGLSLLALVDEDFRRQMQRGLAGFVRAVTLEALNLGASVAAGAEVALAGESSASHTAGVKQALRQAGAQLRATNGPRTAASAAATAMRTALLGARNTLDKEHALERRLNM